MHHAGNFPAFCGFLADRATSGVRAEGIIELKEMQFMRLVKLAPRRIDSLISFP